MTTNGDFIFSEAREHHMTFTAFILFREPVVACTVFKLFTFMLANLFDGIAFDPLGSWYVLIVFVDT